MSKEIILRAENLTKSYDLGDQKITALKDVSLEIREGEFVAIVGKSGSGKSTLMHILGLLDSPTSGKLFIRGDYVEKYSESKLAQIRNKEIGFVFQFFNLLPRTSVLENVVLPLQYSNVPKSKWYILGKQMIEKVGLTDRINNKSNELSGGQKQRVAIARALINDPSIIFADEPTGNLDTKTGQDIEAMFKNLNAEGRTIVLVTHDNDLANIAKRIITIHDGLIVDDRTNNG